MPLVDLERVDHFLIPARIIESTLSALKRYGTKGTEGRLLWVGRLESGQTFRFLEAWEPRQRNSMISTIVPSEELLRINEQLADRRLVLAAQVHSHPGSAYHSDTDDDYPICTQQGSLSLVVPNFASGDPPLNEWACYRLGPNGWGDHLEPRSTDQLLKVIPNG